MNTESTPHLVILALDLGTTTGWALRSANGPVAHGFVSFKSQRFEGGGMRYATFLAHRGVVMKEYGEDGGRREKDVEGAWKELIPEGSGWVGQLEGCLSAEEAANVLEADSNTFQKFPEWKRRALRRKALLYLFS